MLSKRNEEDKQTKLEVGQSRCHWPRRSIESLKQKNNPLTLRVIPGKLNANMICNAHLIRLVPTENH